MRDDLISRKALLKQFIVSDSGRRIPEYDIDNFPITLSIKDVKDIIRKAPTVFDKEKVIEKINREIEYHHEKSKIASMEIRAYSDGAERAYRLLRSIVEKGGIE